MVGAVFQRAPSWRTGRPAGPPARAVRAFLHQGAAGRAGRGPAAVLAQVAGPLNQWRFGMTLAEALVLVAATLLAVAVFMEGRKGTLTSRAGVLLLTLAMLAVVAALLHMLAR